MTADSKAGAAGELLAPLLILGFAFLLTAGWNLHIQAVHNPDEARYAVPARMMLESSDFKTWLVPEFNTRPRLVKPIFFYWLIAATGAVGQKLGLDAVTSFRLGPLLMGLLTVCGTFLIGRKLFGVRCGFIAAVILMTAKFFHDISRDLVVDMTLTAFLLWAWVFALYALDRIRSSRPAFWMLLGFYLCLGFSSMTKGPALAGIFVIAPLLAMLAREGRLSDLRHTGLVWGVPLALAVGLWWFFAVEMAGHNMRAVLKTENLARAVGGKDHQHYMPLWFYIRNLFENFVPWCVLFPFVGWFTYRHLRGAEAAPAPASSTLNGERLLFCALGVGFVLLGLIVSKRALYLLPLYPFFALWLAWFWEVKFLAREGEPCGKSLSAVFVLLPALLVGGCGIVVSKRELLGLQDTELALLLILCGAIAVQLFFVSRSMAAGLRVKATFQILAAAAALCIGYEAVVRPVHERDEDSVVFYRKVCEQLNGRKVVMLGDSSNEAVWYLNRPKESIDDVRYPDLKSRFFDAGEVVLLAKERELLSTPKLKDVLIIERMLERGNDKWVMAVPDKSKTPDPSIFVPKRSRAAAVENED